MAELTTIVDVVHGCDALSDHATRMTKRAIKIRNRHRLHHVQDALRTGRQGAAHGIRARCASAGFAAAGSCSDATAIAAAGLRPVAEDLRHPVQVVSADKDLTQASVQLTVAPVIYAIALRPDDPGQLRAAVNLACSWWGGIRFPWLPLAEDGSVRDDAQKLCDVLDVAGIIDLTRSDASEPVPAGLEPLGLTVVTGDQRPPWGMPIRAVVTVRVKSNKT